MAKKPAPRAQAGRAPKQSAPRRLPTKAEISEWLAAAPGENSRRDIARAFNVKGEDRAELRRMLSEMAGDGDVARKGPKRYQRAGALPPVAALDVMSADDDGDLLLMPAQWDEDAEPPMIRTPRKDAAKIKPAPGPGDRLLCRLEPAGDDGYVARIIRPLGRGAHKFLAVYRAHKNGGIAEPVERRARNSFSIAARDSNGAKDGDLVWVEAELRDRGARRGDGFSPARVRSIEGHVDDKHAFSLMALAAHGARTEMPEDAIAEAERAALPPLGAREDLRALPLLTIDPADAKDHDDAVFAAPDDDERNKGGFRVIVAIADVSWFVRPGTALDREASERGNSIYLPDRVVPMLPEALSNDLCSLKEGVDRPCIAVEMILSANGEKRRHRFLRGTMRSSAKLSYDSAQAIIDGAEAQDARVGAAVRTLDAAYRARLQEREKRAPLDLDLPERKIMLKPDGTVEKIVRRERFDAHKLIEEFMILANVAAAETLEEKRITQIYRTHDAPDPEKIDSVRDYLADLDYSLVKGGSLRPMNFNQLLAIADKRGQKQLVSEIVLRAQSQAVYATENLGHFGLNLARYSHFTSPIRRYADLTIHRALVSACKLGEGGQSSVEAERLEKIAEHISNTERRAMAIEREASDRYLAEYLEGREGEAFDARIRGVTRFGLFVMLDETGADGFVPVRSLGSERYLFDERRHALVGTQSRGLYRLGQSVRVALKEAAPIRGGLIFDMLSDPVEDDGRMPQQRDARKKRPAAKPKGDKRERKDAIRKKNNAKRRRE
jgi:ribonuclease R